MRWLKDQKVEANLRALGIPFETVKANVSDIDFDEGLRRQTRLLGKLNDDYVIQLASAMEQPEAAFPMIILQQAQRGGRMWPWSGNHRGAGFRLAYPNETVIEAYTINLKDPRMQDILPRIVNAWESGLGFSKEEKIINARWLVDNHSMQPAEAAKLVGIPVKWLWVAKRSEDVRKQLIDLGAKADGIPKSILIKMSPIENINSLKATARVITDYKIKGDEAEQLVSDVKAQRTELQQMAELGRWEKLMNERLKPQPKRAPPIDFTHKVRDSFIRYLTGMAKILSKHKTIEQLQCTDPADKDIVARNWIEVARAMAVISQGGGK